MTVILAGVTWNLSVVCSDQENVFIVAHLYFILKFQKSIHILQQTNLLQTN